MPPVFTENKENIAKGVEKLNIKDSAVSISKWQECFGLLLMISVCT